MLRPLNELSLGQRVVLTFVIVLAVLFGLALWGLLTGGWDQADAAEPNLYQGIPLDKKLLELDKQALEAAYHGHLIKLWNVWLADGAKEAYRVTNGLRIARTAYHQAAVQIAKREQELGK